MDAGNQTDSSARAVQSLLFELPLQPSGVPWSHLNSKSKSSLGVPASVLAQDWSLAGKTQCRGQRASWVLRVQSLCDAVGLGVGNQMKYSYRSVGGEPLDKKSSWYLTKWGLPWCQHSQWSSGMQAPVWLQKCSG